MRAHLLQLAAIARGDRGAATARIRDAFSAAGAWITDARFFSGVQTMLSFEAPAERLRELGNALAQAGAELSAASAQALTDAASDSGEVAGTLAVTFADGDPDVVHEVPKVPG